jgi:NADH-quinone oxidoreductase subunit J
LGLPRQKERGTGSVFQGLAFYLFSGVLLLAGLLVISARNPVHSVLFLILAFFNAAGLFVLMGAEFLAMILVVVYVGAVAVLFLFVVMMLDIDFVELRQGFLQYVPFGIVVGSVILLELVTVLLAWSFAPVAPQTIARPVPEAITNTEALGRVLYTDYIYLFQAAGLVLLLAMVGAIVLTLRRREGVKRQVIGRQVGRAREETIELRNVKPGQGL